MEEEVLILDEHPDDRYLLGERIAEGGMGYVHRGRHERTGRAVVLKFARHPSPLIVERARREASLLREVRHPGIVELLAHGTVRGEPVLIYSFVEGQTLADALSHEGRFPWTRVVPIAAELNAALMCLHGRGIVHRDIKPANILLAPGDHPVIVDFGLGRGVDDPRLTEPGKVVATPAYAAPEVLLGNDARPASDLYGLGLVLHELLTGELPQDLADSTRNMILNRVNRAVEVWPAHASDVPPELIALVHALLRLDPAWRPEGQTIALRLESIRSERDPGIDTTRAPSTRKVEKLSLRGTRPPVPASARWVLPGMLLIFTIWLVFMMAGRSRPPGGSPAPSTRTQASPAVPALEPIEHLIVRDPRLAVARLVAELEARDSSATSERETFLRTGLARVVEVDHVRGSAAMERGIGWVGGGARLLFTPDATHAVEWSPFDPGSPQRVTTFPVEIVALATDPRGERGALVGEDGRIWSLERNRWDPAVQDVHEPGSRHGAELAVAGTMVTLIRNGKLSFCNMRSHVGGGSSVDMPEVTCLSAAAPGHAALVGTSGGEVRILDRLIYEDWISPGQESALDKLDWRVSIPREGSTTAAAVTAVHVEGEAQQIVVGDATGRIHRWESQSDPSPRSWRAHESPVRCLAADPASKFIVSGDATGVLAFWTASGEPRAPKLRTGAPLRRMKLRPDGKMLAIVQEGGSLKLLDLRGLLAGGTGDGIAELVASARRCLERTP